MSSPTVSSDQVHDLRQTLAKLHSALTKSHPNLAKVDPQLSLDENVEQSGVEEQLVIAYLRGLRAIRILDG